jgi:hypothetical protein
MYEDNLLSDQRLDRACALLMHLALNVNIPPHLSFLLRSADPTAHRCGREVLRITPSDASFKVGEIYSFSVAGKFVGEKED